MTTPLDRDLVRRLLPGQADLVDDFIDHDVALSSVGGMETLDGTTGKIICDVTKKYSLLAFTGTKAFTLPDGTDAGQEHVVYCTSAGSTPIGTLTVTTPESATGIVCPSTFVFNTAGQSIHFYWTGTKWRVKHAKRAGVQVVVLGTDVLTGYSLNSVMSCSVDGTKDSTGTKALPNGNMPGDEVLISCSSATNTPVGSLDFTGTTLANGAVTHMQAIGATTDVAMLRWTGAAWQVTYSTGITFA